MGIVYPCQRFSANRSNVTTRASGKSYIQMDETLVGTINHGDLSADVYSTNLSGEFKVLYRNGAGEVLEEAPLTGISSYKQRETEIMERLQQLAEGGKAAPVPDRGDAGEY